MKKKVIMLSCIAAVAIASFVGKKTFESNAYENGLMTQNVEALSQSDQGDYSESVPYIPCEKSSGDKCLINVRTANGNATMEVADYRNV